MQGILFYFFALIWLTECQSEKQLPTLSTNLKVDTSQQKIIPAAERIALYLPLLQNKKVGLIVNQTSIVKDKHLVDTLVKLGIQVVMVFAPEHGFRGKADAGETIRDDMDKNTGLPIISLYGNKKKPSPEDLKGIDMLVFDIQDVGVRFYTYISTLHYIMEASAENNIPLIVLDRPNPNGHYVDGPVLQKQFTSFVGMHPVPVVYGMTIGEYAKMINGEKWLKNGIKCDLTVIENKNYSHDSFYELPVKPSPNLPNSRSVLLYPSVCFFEGTTLSLGRGTEKQFQVVGHPELKSDFSFVPMPNEGSKTPPHQGKQCFGKDLTKLTVQSVLDQKKLDLSLLTSFYKEMKYVNQDFFLENLFFDKLAGTDSLRKMLIENVPEESIRASWENDLKTFKTIRLKYLLYD
ncbi:MAG: DUF1343 domain-containing protein [Saprospiraceae bacterium]|nr:DUF1343 domain-containing protein [Saprospiraceae bacterium]